ncbi:DUF4288 domain-containing protein [Gemmata sp. JC717]|uniref:DUF4288 domain-containing protein n=1 Tax=Gemmata algarum TaxID=2975278 RepID=UPI0021BA69B6|nr:DUF4288 domain-containing protein [Gemmata algarum]MDY3555953.1 DUF4288 domain-containing protein [Gemmata algarum]
MGFIPGDARWYLADVVLEHRIDGDAENLVHVNTHLIEAGTPDVAYDKAVALGLQQEREYENSDGGRVRVLFRGLRELNVIHEPLEDGAEIMYTENVGVPEGRLREWSRPREQLGVFRPIEPRAGGPNCLPGVFKPLVEGAEPPDVPGAAVTQAEPGPAPDAAG